MPVMDGNNRLGSTESGRHGVGSPPGWMSGASLFIHLSDDRSDFLVLARNWLSRLPRRETTSEWERESSGSTATLLASPKSRGRAGWR